MKSPGFLIAERPLAQHSERLGAASAVNPQSLAVTLDEALPALRDAIASAVCELTGQKRADVTPGKIERIAAPKAHRLLEPVGVHMALGLRGAGELLVSLGRASALMLTDLMFGGSGKAPRAICPTASPPPPA